MLQVSSGAVLFMTLLGFFSPDLTAGEYLASKELCDTDAILPTPPCCGLNNQPTSRIVFGNITELNEFPWMVRMCNINPDRGCAGATLINTRWVLTAAHNIGSKVIEVSLGEWNITSDPDCVGNFCKPKVKKFIVDKVLKHKLYDGHSTMNDIALLRLPEAVSINDFIGPICLPLNAPTQPEFANKVAIAAGWGMTENGNFSEVLLKASLKILNSKDCNEKSQICTTGVGKSGTRGGDSGGPLMIKIQNKATKLEFYYQIGLLSNGLSGGSEKDAFTYVPDFIDWIKDTIMKNQ